MNADIFSVTDTALKRIYANVTCTGNFTVMGPIDNISPYVLPTSLHPAKDKINVPVNAVVGVKFNEKVGGVNEETLVLLDPNHNLVISVVTSEDDEANLTPKTDLEFGSKYTVLIKNDVTDMFGNRLVDNVSWSFTTVKDIDKPRINLTVNGNYLIGNTYNITEGDTVEFDASESEDNVGIVNYTWTFFDQSENITLDGAKVKYKFNKSGTFTIILTVTDIAGNFDETTFKVKVIKKTIPPVPGPEEEGRATGAIVGILLGISVFIVLISLFVIFKKGKKVKLEKYGGEGEIEEVVVEELEEKEMVEFHCAECGRLGTEIDTVCSSCDTSTKKEEILEKLIEEKKEEKLEMDENTQIRATDEDGFFTDWVDFKEDSYGFEMEERDRKEESVILIEKLNNVSFSLNELKKVGKEFPELEERLNKAADNIAKESYNLAKTGIEEVMEKLSDFSITLSNSSSTRKKEEIEKADEGIVNEEKTMGQIEEEEDVKFELEEEDLKREEIAGLLELIKNINHSKGIVDELLEHEHEEVRIAASAKRFELLSGEEETHRIEKAHIEKEKRRKIIDTLLKQIRHAESSFDIGSELLNHKYKEIREVALLKRTELITAEEKVRLAKKKRLEEKRRRAEEARLLEEKRLAEERRLEEEKRKKLLSYKSKLSISSLKEVSYSIRNIIPNYLITHKIGSGGSANVYKARDLEGKEVAIKLPKFLDDTISTSVLEEFEAEANMWKKLEHENIVKFFFADIRPIPYLVIEVMNGGSLKELMGKHRFGIDEAIEIMLMVLDAMAYSHKMASVHRDLKPENILFSQNGTPKISDWGVGKFMASESVSKSLGTKGTLSYCAPEQISKRKFGNVDWSTDVFQLGIIFYEMLAGVHPFKDDDPAGIMGKIMEEEPDSLGNLNPNTPKDLEDFVMKALQKQKKNRWDSAVTMYYELNKFIESGNKA